MTKRRCSGTVTGAKTRVINTRYSRHSGIKASDYTHGYEQESIIVVFMKTPKNFYKTR
jgi:hypothetical protein